MLKPQNRGRIFTISNKAGLERNLSLFADGHESGELLQKIGRRDVLRDALRNERVPIDSDQYNREDFADLAGFLALLKAFKAGDASIRIPFFSNNRENHETMGRRFGLIPLKG